MLANGLRVDLLLTGRLIDASDAFRMGLINEVVHSNLTPNDIAAGIPPSKTALDRALEIAKELAESSRTLSPSPSGCWLSAAQVQPPTPGWRRKSADARLHIEAKSGLKAFLDKKPVPWMR